MGLTVEQQAALNSQGEAIVSASAGSGKTFVMIKKITDLILDGKASVNEVLAVTFTKLAAAQMKDKLKSALIKQIITSKDEEKKEKLSNELFMVNSADISTIHSLCAKLLKRYFYAIDINVDCSIMDDVDATDLKAQAMESLFESKYKTSDKDFLHLLKIYTTANKDNNLKKLISSLYDNVVSMSNYEQFLSNCLSKYSINGFDEVCAVALSQIKRKTQSMSSLCYRLLQEAKKLVDSSDLPETFLAYLDSFAEVFDLMLSKDDYFEFVNLPSPEYLKKPVLPKAFKENQTAVSFNKVVDEVKDNFKKFIGEYTGFNLSKEKEFSLYIRSKETASALSTLLLEFASNYKTLKQDACKLDYNDLEHYTLTLLSIDKYRVQIASTYKYVFIDEYQDVNPVQEAILTKLSNNNAFMVGDIKQSIYAFRGCKSEFFSQKFALLNRQGKNALTLNANFRSDKEVVDGVNKIFSKVMDEDLCGVDYANKSMMRQGIEKDGGSFNIHFVSEMEKIKEEADEVYSVKKNFGNGKDKGSAEGKLIADLILHSVKTKKIDDRFYNYGDIVILVRNNTNKTKAIIAELVEMGIPISSSAEVNVCDYSEVKQLIQILKYIDCPDQDIPLATALKSPIANFTDDMLAKISIFANENYPFTTDKFFFYQAVDFYAKTNNDEISNKIKEFLDYMSLLRMSTSTLSSQEIVNKIFEDKNLDFYYLSLPCGEARLRRVKRFIDEMRANDTDMKVKDFLLRLKNLDYRIGLVEAGGLNAVRVMSIHASKGLEFPMVIVTGMNNPFSTEDLRENVFFDDEYGIITKAYDNETLTKSETILRDIIKEKRQVESSKNEMFLFYVALTRAEKDLHLIFKKSSVFAPENVRYAKSYADFVDLSLFDEKEIPCASREFELQKRQVLLIDEDKKEKHDLLEKMNYKYEQNENSRVIVETSASKLVTISKEERLRDEGTQKNFDESDEYLSSSKRISAKDRGSAYHRFLECVDFSKVNKDNVSMVLPSLKNDLGKYYDMLSVEKLKQIVSMPAFEKLKEYKVYKECDFITNLSANQIDELKENSNANVFVSGAIDMLAVNEKECLIYDYKFTSRDREQIIQTYLPQLKLYANVIKKAYPDKEITVKLINIKKQEEINISID